VIGGGYTGMWAAWHIARLEPGCRVLALEADRAGHGPSGRNGGFCNTLWFSLPALRARLGDEAALEVARATEAAVEEVGRFCAEQGVDAWYREGGYLRVSTCEAHDRVLTESLAACRELGAGDAARELSPDEVAARCRSPLFRGAVLYPGASVQPARLAFGLAAALGRAGVEILERSKVVNLRAPRGGGVEAQTETGTVRAGSAVVAIGGAAGGGGWKARSRLTIASSHMAITEPVPELLEEIGWTGGETVSDCRALLHYFRTTPDGRIAFGWGGGRIAFDTRLGGRAERDPAVTEQVIRDLREFFPGLEGRTVEHAWGGPIDTTPTHLPLVTQRAEGRIATAFGYTGNGVGPSQMIGRTLASLALRRDDAEARLPLVDPAPRRVPPEPLRWIGGNAIRAALERTERAELAGRRPGPISNAIAAIPRRIGFHIGR
jgi:glycine/D-amino acid oxidase-like deaminating enzyme